MRKINYFIGNYGELIEAFLMSTLFILNMYVLYLDWNIWSLVGAIGCCISAILNLTNFIKKIRK